MTSRLDAKNILALRKEVIENEGTEHETSVNYLIIYNENGEEIAKSEPTHPQLNIKLELNGLTFFAPPIAKKNGEDEIYISLSSIKEFIKK